MDVVMSNNVIQGYPTPPKDYYKVYVCSTTYNQSPYIEDCLNGVAMQKTDFPFVHHVIMILYRCRTGSYQSMVERMFNMNL